MMVVKKKKSKMFLQDDKEIYITNSDGTPKRIPKSQWLLQFHNRIKEEDELGNKTFVPVRREQFKKFNQISKKDYMELTGLIILNGRWQPKPKKENK